MPFSEIRVPRFGYTSADPRTNIPPDMLITGSKNLTYRGEMELESWGGWKLTDYGGASSNRGGDLSFIVGRGWATVGDELNEGSGNIIEFVGRSLWFTGTGDITVYQPGITATPQALGNSALQNGIPQVATLNQNKNGYNVPVQVGLLAELTSPFITARATVGAGFQGIMNGTFSIQASWIRDSTGAESLPSAPSNVITLANQTVIANFTNSPTNSPLPRDKWRIYATKSNFGDVGPYFFLMDVPFRRINDEFGTGFAVEDSGGSNFNKFRRNPLVSGYFSSEQIGKRIFWASPTVYGGRITGVTGNTFTYRGVTYGDYALISPNATSISTLIDNWDIDGYLDGYENAVEIEWLDNELASVQPPTDNYPPASTASFIVGLVNVMVLIGTEDGLGVAVSVPNFPESYPPDFRLQLIEPPIGVLARPQDAFFYIVCSNSVHKVMWTGAVDGAPVTILTVADQLGSLQQNAMCQAGPDLYLFGPGHKPLRILSSGVVDREFGDRLEAEFKTWTAGDVNISYDERKNSIMYAYTDRCVQYFPAYDAWTPVIFYADQETNGRPLGIHTSMFTLKGIIHQSYYLTETPSVSITASTAIVTTAAPFFTDKHLGKLIDIPGAAAGPSQLTGRILSLNSSQSANLSQIAAFTVGPVVATIRGFDLYTADRDTSDNELNFSTSWAARYSFSDYGVSLNPKTVTLAELGTKSTAGTYNLKFYRNYNTSVQMGSTRSFVAASGNHVQNLVDCWDGEAQLLSVHLEGTGVRDKFHFLKLTGDDSGIAVNYGV